VARVLADNEYLAMASDNLAFVAHFLDRRTYLHSYSSFRQSSVSRSGNSPASLIVALASSLLHPTTNGCWIFRQSSVSRSGNSPASLIVALASSLLHPIPGMSLLDAVSSNPHN
jgi:hypothetical protein